MRVKIEVLKKGPVNTAFLSKDYCIMAAILNWYLEFLLPFELPVEGLNGKLGLQTIDGSLYSDHSFGFFIVDVFNDEP